MAVDAIAIIKLLTPLERGRSQRNESEPTRPTDEQNAELARVRDHSRMGGHDLCTPGVYNVHIVRDDRRQNNVHLGR